MPENVKVPDWLWGGAGGGREAASGGGAPQPVRDFYVFGHREKKKGKLKTANKSHFSLKIDSFTTYQKISSLSPTVSEI